MTNSLTGFIIMVRVLNSGSLLSPESWLKRFLFPCTEFTILISFANASIYWHKIFQRKIELRHLFHFKCKFSYTSNYGYKNQSCLFTWYAEKNYLSSNTFFVLLIMKPIKGILSRRNNSYGFSTLHVLSQF